LHAASYNLGRGLFQLERYDEAERALSNALALDPDEIRYLRAMAALQMKTGRCPEAIEAYRRILGREPETALTRYSLGICLIQTGAEEDAMTELERAHELDPTLLEAPLNLAILHERSGRFEPAARWYEKTLQIREHPVALLNLGQIYARHYSDIPRAVELFEQAARIAPDDAVVFYNLGMAYRYAGEEEKSRAALAQAARLDPALAERLRRRGPG
jgi:tetratricopeptide (TPR) repeat protein